MTTRYVGIGGNDASDGLSWANRKLTLNGVEDTPVEAGDTVYIGAGTYRAGMTVDVSGESGSPISYIGDIDGSHTDGVGGVIRVTGATSNEQGYDGGVTRLVFASGEKNYRTFKYINFDSSAHHIYNGSTSGNWILDKCIFSSSSGNYHVLRFDKAPGNLTVTNCIFLFGFGGGTGSCIYLQGSDKNDATYTIENCLFVGMNSGVYSNGCGNVTIRNSTFYHSRSGARTNAVNTSYPMVVNNCIFYGCDTAMSSNSASQITENYNNINGCGVARTNVGTGAQSLTYITNFDVRWASELLWFGGAMITPFDIGSISALIDVAGTSPTTADMRGTTVQGTQREWGALEYDSTLDIEAGSGTGGAVRIIPFTGKVGL